MKNHWIKKLYVFVIDDGEYHWIIERNEDKAIKFLAEACGFTVEEYLEDYEGITIEVLDNDYELELTREEDGLVAKKTVKEWIKEHGEGYLGSTCF